MGKDVEFLRHHEVASVASGYLSNLGRFFAKLGGV